MVEAHRQFVAVVVCVRRVRPKREDLVVFHFSAGDENGHWLLKHGVGAKPMNSEIDTPLNYGDYYFLEALLRFRNSAKK